MASGVRRRASTDRYIAGGHSLRLRRPGPALSARAFSIRCPGGAGHERRSGRPHTRVLTGRPVVGFLLGGPDHQERVAVEGGAAVHGLRRGLKVRHDVAWKRDHRRSGPRRGSHAALRRWRRRTSRGCRRRRRGAWTSDAPWATCFCLRLARWRRVLAVGFGVVGLGSGLSCSRDCPARKTLIEGGSDARDAPTYDIPHAISGVCIVGAIQCGRDRK